MVKYKKIKKLLNIRNNKIILNGIEYDIFRYNDYIIIAYQKKFIRTVISKYAIYNSILTIKELTYKLEKLASKYNLYYSELSFSEFDRIIKLLIPDFKGEEKREYKLLEFNINLNFEKNKTKEV